MGCTQSKIDNEEAVTRCKERRLHMKAAVSARNAFAAAHSSYAMSLKNTGAALSDYAHGEANPGSHHGSHHPPIPSSLSAPSAAPAVAPPAPPLADTLLPPPPPPANFVPTPAPLQRAATMPEIKLPKPEPKPKPKPRPIAEDEELEDDHDPSANLRRRRSGRSGGRGGAAPPVEESRPAPVAYQQQETFEYFFNVENMPRPTLSDMEEMSEVDQEIARKAFDEMPKRAEGGEKVEEVVAEAAVAEKAVEEDAALAPPPPPEAVAGNGGKKGKQSAGAGSSSGEGKRMVKANVNLVQIFIDLDDHFLKASESAHEVSKMLEATRLHYHSNFADNRGHIDHSARVMRVITWNRSFRNLPNNDHVNDDFDSEEQETHATVLDKLLAWEKKLYDEVKAGEQMKFDYQRKVNALSRLKNRGGNSDALEKAKATVSLLHTRYIVDMQSMDSTVSEINRLRDQQLYPKLVQLVDGMATMWEIMRKHHEQQSRIVEVLRNLNISQTLKETSEHHHNTTRQLYGVVQEWRNQFEKLVQKQREYIRSLTLWLKLNLVPTDTNLKEKVSSPPRTPNPPIKKLLLAWQDHLDKLPDEVAKSAIANFAAVIETIVIQQDEEMRLREKCEDTRKELGRKTRAFEDWYNKYMQRRIPDEVDVDRAEGTPGPNEAVVERQLAVELVKKRLEDEQEVYRKHCQQVREKSLISLKLRLPELFRALSDFSIACSEMYKDLRSRSQPRNRTESSA